MPGGNDGKQPCQVVTPRQKRRHAAPLLLYRPRPCWLMPLDDGASSITRAILSRSAPPCCAGRLPARKPPAGAREALQGRIGAATRLPKGRGYLGSGHPCTPYRRSRLRGISITKRYRVATFGCGDSGRARDGTVKSPASAVRMWYDAINRCPANPGSIG